MVRRPPPSWWLPVALVAAFAVLSLAVAAHDPLPGERPVLRAVHAGDDPGAGRWLAVSDATSTQWLAVVAAATALVLVGRRRAADGALVVLAFGSAWVLVPVLKALVGRPRPPLWPLPADVSEHGYPSGHAAASAALVGALLVVHRRGAAERGRVAVALVAAAAAGAVAAVAAAQLALGRHWPSDLVAGWLLGTACVAVSARAARPRDG